MNQLYTPIKRILQTMQLRNGKTMAQNQSKKPIEYDNDTEVVRFMQEATSMIHEIEEWDVITARIGGILELYKYLNDDIVKFKDHPRLASFVQVIKARVPIQFEEVAGILKKHSDDLYILELIDSLTYEMIRLLKIFS